MGKGMSQLRSMYPENRIVMLPDASGKEIMQGWVKSANENAIELVWNGRNPSITERIMAINKAYQLNQLKIMEPYADADSRLRGQEEQGSLLDRFILGMETRDFDDMGKPRKGKGPQALDHGCDAAEYGSWHIIHTIRGYDDILLALKGVHHKDYEAA
jgi:hypothetical protein